ncbi:MAG: type II toxin-antitoxin system VapC family toxin [Methanobrevibacter smithii]|jgi:predicted nucleic acid-binding protein|uniref:type II toxin-antitoxin system VapC family toxin n=1 Tax=Methanobrevibacter TaxID=2172 RepID=UPI00037E6840|nr:MULTISPECIES: type II toxin-antitoxin system VapC family toxin [Methanobrevibacter]URN49419.1 type II toxin-antitoxin system VapC family toxin [Methanobrevibacter sp. TLL-48-HuF1]
MRKIFLDTSFILAYINSNDDLHENALKLEEAENILSQNVYINNNVLNEVLTLTGRKMNIDAAEEIYYSLVDSFEILNEYTILNYTAKTFDIFKKIVGDNSKKTKLSFTDSSIILTMKESNITELVSFNQQFKNFNKISLIGLDYL